MIDVNGLASLQPILSMFGNTTQNTYSSTYTYTDRGSADTSNCYPMPPADQMFTFRDRADVNTIKPFTNAGNRRIKTSPFLLKYAICNVQGFPVWVQVNTLCWNKRCNPGTDLLVPAFLDAMFESTYAVQAKMDPQLNTQADPVSASTLAQLKILNDTAEVEKYLNGSTTGVQYHLAEGNPDWKQPNLRQRIKLLVRRKRVLLPPGAIYNFALAFKPPRYLKFEDLTANYYKMVMEKALMITFGSECGVKGLVVPGSSVLQYSATVLSDKIILPIKLQAMIKAQVQYIWPKIVIYARDKDMIEQGAGAQGEQTGMNKSAQPINLGP